MDTKTNKQQLVTRLLIPSVFLFTFSILFFNCKKTALREIAPQNVAVAQTSGSSTCDSLVCEDCAFQETIENDTAEYPTILGGTFSNPYSIQTMTQAYNLVHGTKVTSVATTHYYVKFKPQTVNDLNKLDSLDLELYDYPLDRVVNQDGDYWPDAYVNLPANGYPWLYTVVPSNFQFPAGITYQNLAPLNIPDDDPALEDQAFSLTGNLECGNPAAITKPEKDTSSSSNRTVIPNIVDCGEGYHWDYTLNKCVANNCPSGYHWDYTQRACVPDPPPPPPGNLHPQGMITYKTYNDFGVIPALAPLKFTRIVARRFYKIDKTYTDANGNFQLTKRFPHKVTIIVKFKTSSVSLRQQPQIVFTGWKRWFPVKKNIGTYKGKNLQNLSYVFEKGSTSRKMRTRRWLSAIAINTHIETRNFLSSNNMMQLPNKLNIWLVNPHGDPLGETLQYEFVKRSYFDIDGVHLEWLTSDMNSMTTSKVTINVAEQLAICYLAVVNNTSQDGINFLAPYDASLDYAASYMPSQYFRFGTGVPTNYYNPNLVAVWQAFAQHLGHTMANKIYGANESSFQLQGKTWISSGGVSSSAKYLEGFSPKITEPYELFRWIPVGLINDLMDTQPEAVVVDNVSGFSYSDIQAAYYGEPGTMAALKAALRSMKPSQASAIDLLFAGYGY